MCLTVSFSCGIVYEGGNRTPDRDKKPTPVYLIKRKIQKKILCTYIADLAETLRPTALPHDSALHHEVFCLFVLMPSQRSICSALIAEIIKINAVA